MTWDCFFLRFFEVGILQVDFKLCTTAWQQEMCTPNWIAAAVDEPATKIQRISTPAGKLLSNSHGTTRHQPGGIK
jgi:hypothetical protein